jgi:hypothetical protein
MKDQSLNEVKNQADEVWSFKKANETLKNLALMVMLAMVAHKGYYTFTQFETKKKIFVQGQ